MLVQGLVVERGVEEQSIQAGVVAVLLELAKNLLVASLQDIVVLVVHDLLSIFS